MSVLAARGRFLRAVPVALLICFAPSAVAGPRAGDTLRQQLESQATSGGDAVAGELSNAAVLRRFYAARDHRPLWSGDGEFAGQLDGLLNAIRSSADHGFRQERYHLSKFEAKAAAGDAHQRAWLELLATDAFLLQALHRVNGVVPPSRLDPDWTLLAEVPDALVLLEQRVRVGGAVPENLIALWPEVAEYQALVRERARVLEEGDLVAPPVSSGVPIRPGQEGERIAMLRVRLLGPTATGDRYDEELQRAVHAFQLASGLDPDGIVGDATLEALNASRVQWIDRLDANLERWRWLPRAVDETRIRVNIAAFTLRVIDRGEDALRMRVIAGRPARRSPVFAELMRYLVFNPYWNVPFKLATQDKLPLLRLDSAPLVAQGYEVGIGAGGAYRSLQSVDWAQVSRANFPYQLRQKPGPQNALGQVKFMMPNRHAVYLHDTPNRDLFAKEERAFSSGCIRLSEPLKLAEWLLRNDGQEAAVERIPGILKSGETVTVHLRRPVATHIVYFTAFIEDGRVLYRRDVYQRDKSLVAALRG